MENFVFLKVKQGDRSFAPNEMTFTLLKLPYAFGCKQKTTLEFFLPEKTPQQEILFTKSNFLLFAGESSHLLDFAQKLFSTEQTLGLFSKL